MARPVLPDAQLQVFVSEEFVNRLLSTQRVDTGPVRDCILGADVFGGQVTNTQVDIDVRPSDDEATFLVRISGQVRNRTVGVTPQAAVHSEGSHDLHLTKQVSFDGVQLTTRSPSAWITPRIANRAANTPVSGLPFVGAIASSVALSEAERMRPAAESIAASRITQQLAPQFNSAVDEQLTFANRQWQSHALPLLQSGNVPPVVQVFSSTDSHLVFGARMTDGEAPPAVSPPYEPTLAGASVAIHESLVNAALKRLPIAGREVHDNEIDEWLEDMLQKLSLLTQHGDASIAGVMVPVSAQPGTADSGESAIVAPQHEPPDEYGVLRAPAVLEPPQVDAQALPAGMVSIVFSRDQPLQARLEGDEIVITALVGFRLAGVADIPTQQVDIPFRIRREEMVWAIEPGEVKVTSLNPAGENAAVELARTVIRQQVERRLQPIRLPGTYPLRLPGLPQRHVSISEVVLQSGWLLLSLD